MLQPLISKIKQKKTLTYIALATTITLVSSGYLYLDSLNSIKISSLLSTGLSTCFQRVSQTFTSLAIADKNSAYLQDSFTSLTSECFAEVISTFNQSYLKSDTKLASKLNGLSSDVHWFQKRAKNLKTVYEANEYSENDWFQDEASKNTGADTLAIRKYESLEVMKDEIVDVIDYNQARLTTYTQYLTNVLAIAGLLLLAIGLYGFRQYQNSFKFIKHFEKWANDLLQGGRFNDSYRVEQLLTTIFDKLGLVKTKELFVLYHGAVMERIAAKAFVETSETKEAKIGEVVKQEIEVAPIKTVEAPIEVKSEVKIVIEDPILDKPNQDAINVNSILADVIDMLSEKAFTHGVLIDLDIDEELCVWGKEEVLQQVFYSTVTSAITSSLNHNKGRKITLRSKSLGKSAYIKLTVNGHVFKTEEINQTTQRNAEVVDINLKLMSELMSDVDGKIVLRNLFDEQGELSSSCTELLFDRAPAATDKAPVEDKSRLVSVKKGKKKDLIREIRSNQ